MNSKFIVYIVLVLNIMLSGCGSSNTSTVNSKIDSIYIKSNECKAGNASSCHKAAVALHNLCENKTRSEKTCPASLSYYNKGCELNNYQSCNVLAYLYKKDNYYFTIDRNPKLFVLYAEKSFNLGNRIYSKELADYYKLGKGVKRDFNKYIYYKKVYEDKNFLSKFPTYATYAKLNKQKFVANKKKEKSRSISFGSDKYGVGMGGYAAAKEKCMSAAEYRGINYQACYQKEIKRLRSKTGKR